MENIPNIIKDKTFKNLDCTNIQQILQSPINGVITFAKSTTDYPTAADKYKKTYIKYKADISGNTCYDNVHKILTTDKTYNKLYKEYKKVFANTQLCAGMDINNCYNCLFNNNNLSCTCLDNNGIPTQTTLSESYSSCAQSPTNNFANCNGQLVCVPNGINEQPVCP